MPEKTRTPCIGICSTGLGDDICRGCKRFAHEVIQWNGYTNGQKALVNRRIEQLLSSIVRGRVTVVDETRFREVAARHAVDLLGYEDLYCQIYCLLNSGYFSLHEADACGLRLNPRTAVANQDALQLCEQIDTELFILSEAHYQRYIMPSTRITESADYDS